MDGGDSSGDGDGWEGEETSVWEEEDTSVWGEEEDNDNETDGETGWTEPPECAPAYTRHVVPIGVPTAHHAVGDIDGDGWIDVVAGVYTPGVDDGGAVLLRGTGPASFVQTHIDFPFDPVDVDLGDIDGDGDLDLLLPQPVLGVLILRWGGDAFDPGETVSPWPNSIDKLELADLDGDGDLDMVVARWSSFRVMRNDGGGDFVGAALFVGEEDGLQPAFGDLDGSGSLDLVTAHGEVWLGNGNGMFVDTDGFQTVGLADTAAIADLDGDGNLDAVVNNRSEDTVTVALGDGTGGFAEILVLPGGDQPVPVAAFDANGDGSVDVVFGNRLDGTVSIYCDLESAPLTFEILEGGFEADEFLPDALAHADFDGDGIDELVTANGGAESITMFSTSF